MKVFDYIRAHVAKSKPGNGRLACLFWTQSWAEYELAWDVSTELPDPEEGDCSDLDEELLEGMEKARSRNPAERQPGPLSHYLESCAKMSTCALYGVLNVIQPGPTLCQAHAQKLQLSCFKYFARINIDYRRYYVQH